MQLTGKVIKVLPKVAYGKEGKQKSGLVIEYSDGRKSRNIAFTVFGQALEKVDLVSVGETVTVDFNLESREWNEKWFTDAILFSVEKSQSVEPVKKSSKVEVTELIGNNNTDLPF